MTHMEEPTGLLAATMARPGSAAGGRQMGIIARCCTASLRTKRTSEGRGERHRPLLSSLDPRSTTTRGRQDAVGWRLMRKFR